MYKCVICGYDRMNDSHYFDDKPFGVPTQQICQCCGFESGYDDIHKDFSQLEMQNKYRSKWISEGAIWFQESQKPIHWDLKKQLLNIGIILD